MGFEIEDRPIAFFQMDCTGHFEKTHHVERHAEYLPQAPAPTIVKSTRPPKYQATFVFSLGFVNLVFCNTNINKLGL